MALAKAYQMDPEPYEGLVDSFVEDLSDDDADRIQITNNLSELGLIAPSLAQSAFLPTRSHACSANMELRTTSIKALGHYLGTVEMYGDEYGIPAAGISKQTYETLEAAVEGPDTDVATEGTIAITRAAAGGPFSSERAINLFVNTIPRAADNGYLGIVLGEIERLSRTTTPPDETLHQILALERYDVHISGDVPRAVVRIESAPENPGVERLLIPWIESNDDVRYLSTLQAIEEYLIKINEPSDEFVTALVSLLKNTDSDHKAAVSAIKHRTPPLGRLRHSRAALE